MEHVSSLAKSLIWLLVVAGLPQYSRGQVRNLEKGSLEAFRKIEEIRARAEMDRHNWRESKQLTLLGDIPKSPRGQDDCLSPSDLRNGSTGYLECWQYEVMQVIGPRDVILNMGSLTIPPIWLTDYSTKELADGDKARIVGMIEADGTKSYTTVTGAKTTIRVVRLVSEERNAELAALAEKKAWQEKWDAKKRTWTDNTGKHTVEAVYDGYIGDGKFRLLKENKAEIVITPSRLSAEDRREIAKLRRIEKEAETKAQRQAKGIR